MTLAPGLVQARHVDEAFDVVAVGASLGGLDAVRTLLRGIQAEFPSPIVIVQHRTSDAGPLLVELLSSQSRLPVSEPSDKEPIEGGHVYLAPPDYHLLVDRGFFTLSIDEPVCHARPSIDVLFESMADSYGPLAVAVVLTGSSRDGAEGARAVKACGGRVLVQDPKTAWSPIAPRAVLASTTVDAVVDVEKMAERLATLRGAATTRPSDGGAARAAP